ncbi:S8 family serine peptidase, partial [Streptomyces sp. S9]|nr:S8 family serine peptidase [Streptomyces sp. S9]
GFGDTNGHGSHTASTAAGNAWTANFKGRNIRISGVAPHANIVAYDICYTNIATGQGLCPNVSAVAAIDQAIADGVDVINYSIGGGANPWGEAVSLAFLNAADAGIFIA